MFRKSIRAWMLSVRYSVCDFMGSFYSNSLVLAPMLIAVNRV